MPKKKKSVKSARKRTSKSPKQAYNPANRNYLVIVGALIAVLLVLFLTFMINKSKLNVEDSDYIDVTPEAVSDNQ